MPEPEAVNDIADHVLHELRRALSRSIYRIHKGGAAPMHEFALARGWLQPALLEPSMLALTDLGLRVLAEDQIRRGLR